MNKREFLRTSAGATLGVLLGDTVWARFADLPPSQLAREDDFWGAVREKYRLKPDYINLESGYYTIQATPVLEAFIAKVREINYQGSYYLRTTQVPDKAAARDKVAVLAGCAPRELCITRNTTESIDTVINGYEWKAGDETVLAESDYPHMIAQFKLIARRRGTVNKIVVLPLDPKSDDEIVRLYAAAITPRTRLLMVSHMVNVTGQILPVRKIADMAHARGVDVLIDGAHSFAHIDFKIPDLGGDYFAASLHKWLGCPLGTGILYVRRDKIAKLWPVYADWRMTDDTDIMKLNHTGTHPVHTDLAIEHAIAFHETIGIQRKEARLRHLQTYWTSQVRQIPGAIMNTPSDASRACAIANVGVKGVKATDLAQLLLDKYRIFTNAVDNDAAGIHGVRVTPNIFIMPSELDTLVNAIREIARAA
jgi:selenocysteine lyase/cysteine desulfurase